jgi:hypothetical protein
MKRPIDWPRVVATLSAHGIATVPLAARLSATSARLSDIASGAQEPRYSEGEALLELWCDVMDKPLCDVPRRERS